MGVSRVTSTLTISGQTEADTIVAHMHYLVGFGLSRWHFVEQDLTMIYLMLVCPSDGPVDGALATFMNVQTTDAKIVLLTKVITQVLFQDRFNDFRARAKKDLRRIQTLNEIRNQLAHGWARKVDGEDPKYQPFYNIAHNYRVKSLKNLGSVPSTIISAQSWDLKTLIEKVDSLAEAATKSHALWRDLCELFEETRTTLETTPRMTLDMGLPFDPNSQGTAQPQKP
ncbi:MAG: hypothetical protein O9272_05900 [Brevundimonas sp.]|nr:hypothetical protein [Brevundimonas sp.]